MENLLITKLAAKTRPVPVDAVTPAGLEALLEKVAEGSRRWVRADGFKAQAGAIVVIPDADGGVGRVLFGLGAEKRAADPFAAGRLARSLPQGVYALGEGFGNPRLAALAWLLDAYSFTRYRKAAEAKAKLVCPQGVDAAALLAQARAVKLTRDLVNTPSSDMGPAELADAAQALCRQHRGKSAITSGAKLAREFPMIHAVGRASTRAPRLVDMSWGSTRAPKITLVGKGVCFDTGGLDIKPASGMLLMKKDMGGAANVLGLASMILEAKLPVRLRVLIPAVENSISGDAFRPGDVLQSRKGMTVEIGNTDAEGRLVLADALDLADAESPDVLISMATLTGAARVALGPDMPPFYTGDDDFAAGLAAHAVTQNDPLWRMPFWDPYDRWLESRVADLNNVAEGGFAGSITAALFLRRFVEKAKIFAHFDVFAWTPSARPGRPQGGEAQAIRALFAWLAQRYPR
ncbi:MAG: leucyl aminopeptidase family protein [Aestuariivirgaceae bacterium]|nr:leucyl aminopeptidase family protein [Aestuariivirgaceae bacterium]